MLPNQQFSSRGASPALTGSLSQGSAPKQPSMSHSKLPRERGHLKLKQSVSAPGNAEGGKTY